MSAYRLSTPSRLHFGLLATGSQATRQFGGVGLMIERPGLVLTARPAPSPGAQGPLASRVRRFAERVAKELGERGIAVPTIHFTVDQAPPEHVGLGTGTQLGLAIARLVTALAGQPDLPVATLATLAGRGLRSGIGLHGFAHGGLIVDGGRRLGDDRGLPPLISRMAWPDDWAVLVLLPRDVPGLHGPAESGAFAQLPAVPDALTDRLCRILLLGLLPALAEHDLDTFGTALSELQRHVGEWFATSQGGLYAHPELESIAHWLRDQGLHGVGQSSWGPALYGLSEQSPPWRAALRDRACERFGLAPSRIFWTVGHNQGAVIREEP